MSGAEWVLVLFFHVGPMGDGNSNAVTNVPGFSTEQVCVAAGEKAKRLTRNTVKATEFVCLPRK